MVPSGMTLEHLLSGVTFYIYSLSGFSLELYQLPSRHLSFDPNLRTPPPHTLISTMCVIKACCKEHPLCEH